MSPVSGTALTRTGGDEVNGLRRGLLLGGAALAACSVLPRPATAAGSKAPGVSIDQQCRVSASRLDSEVAKAWPSFNSPVILQGFDAKTHGAGSDVDLYRLTTHTIVPETGEKLKVSGLLALPAGARGELLVVSWQHGTILSFDQVPSNLTRLSDPAYSLTDSADSLETLFNIQRFAAQGHAVIAADYVGKGPYRDGRGEGYAVKGVSVRTCLDMLAAGRSAMKPLGVSPGKLFLNGWSQGALNTQWLHQALRMQSQPIAATATASPFNDLNEAWNYWAGFQSFAFPAGVTSYPGMPVWISLCMIVTLGSYQLQYKLPGLLESAIRPEFHEMALKYWADYATDFDTSKSFPTGSNLLVPEFFTQYTDDRNSAFLRYMAANRASYWNYDSPIRFHYGLADEAIHPAMVYRALSAGGKMASGIPTAGASHRGTFLASLYGTPDTLNGASDILAWFRSFA